MKEQFWGRGADDWIAIQEPLQRPVYEGLLQEVSLEGGDALLDAGCGSGVLSALASECGAVVTGLDASPMFVEIAKRRCPNGRFLVADLEKELPFDNESFDAVAFSNSLQFVPNAINALREAARTLRQGGRVAIAVFDVPEKCDGQKPIAAILSLLPARPPGGSGPFALSGSGVLESLIRDAGLTLKGVRAVDTPWRYPDLETARRAFMSAGPAHQVRALSGEAELHRVLDTATAPYRQPDGTYLLQNSFIVAAAQKEKVQ